MRVDAFSVMIFRLSTTPGTTSCSSRVQVLGVLSNDHGLHTLEARVDPRQFHTGRRFAYEIQRFRSQRLDV